LMPHSGFPDVSTAFLETLNSSWSRPRSIANSDSILNTFHSVLDSGLKMGLSPATQEVGAF
jgi:hypothetical protein